MTMTPAPPVSRVIAALEAARADDEVFAPDCVSWHNFDEAEVPTVPDSFEGLRAVHRVVPDYRIRDVACHDTGADVSVAQFVLTGTLPDGSALRAPGVLVALPRGARRPTRGVTGHRPAQPGLRPARRAVDAAVVPRCRVTPGGSHRRETTRDR